jgi:cytoskeletal protein RodZ
MSSGATAVVIVVVVLIVALLAALAVSTRRRRLQRQFGPEYDRAVTEQQSKLRAEAELTDRQRRVRKLDIRPLSEVARRQYSADWMAIQERFVESPQSAVTGAYALVTKVMKETGYPVEDDDQAMADLSVEHSETVGHYRAARQITTNGAAGNSDTEDLRQALIHYRALFSELLGEPHVNRGIEQPGTDSNWRDKQPVSTGSDSAANEEVIAGEPADDQPDFLRR